MGVKRDKNLNYLAMDFDLSIEGGKAITMPHDVNKVIQEFPGKLRNLNNHFQIAINF